MRVLIIHQNFPAQYKHIAPALVAQGHEVTTITLSKKASLKGVRVVPYTLGRAPAPDLIPFLKDLETKAIRGESLAKRAADLQRKEGYRPDIIIGHPGWGEMLFLKDVWPDVPMLGFMEFYYHAKGFDVNFDPEFSGLGLDNFIRIRAKNGNNLLSLEACTWGISPTAFQRSTFPEFHQDRISVCHDGIDTTLLAPDASARATLADGRVLTREDEVITFVNRNLEPYRGYHVFMRALPRLLKERPRANVFIVGGDGTSYGRQPPQGKTHKQIYLDEVRDRLDMSRVHFLGRIPYRSYVHMLQLSQVHVYLTYPFVLGWSMIEAMSLGAVVVGSATGPVTEVIRDGDNGLLVDFFDGDGLVDTICRVLDHPDRMADVQRRARETAIAGYDLQTVCLPRHMELIQTLADGRLPTV